MLFYIFLPYSFFILSLSVTLQPSTVVYMPLVLSEVKEFFAIHDNSRHILQIDSASSRMRQAVSSRLEELKIATKTELANVVGGLVKGHTEVSIETS